MFVIQSSGSFIPISVNEEDVLWNKNILDLDTSISLLWAMIFIIGKHLPLGRSGAKEFETSQYAREKVVMDGKCIECYSYKEFGSKNCQGGIDSFNMQNKVVQQYKNGSNLQRCYVNILGK